LKPIKEKRLRDDLGDDGFALLQKVIIENEKLRKKVNELETRFDNIQARLLRLELRDEKEKVSQEYSA
jgi:predicted nuclease with TOPRIM domain